MTRVARTLSYQKMISTKRSSHNCLVLFLFAALFAYQHSAMAATSAPTKMSFENDDTDGSGDTNDTDDIDDADNGDDEEVSVSASKVEDDTEGETESVKVSPFTEEQRLKGFRYHQQLNKKFDEYRLSGASAVKKDRRRWELLMAETLPAYKTEKAGEKKALDETSPAYKKDLKKKSEYDVWLEGARKRYVQARDKARDQRKKSIRLSELEEYDLLKIQDRVDLAKRTMFSGKVAKAKGDSGSSSSSGNNSFPPNNPSFESTPAPPPMPSTGDFYEPDIPPPPPVPMPMDGNGGFDDTIQPPIFDEPEF